MYHAWQFSGFCRTVRRRFFCLSEQFLYIVLAVAVLALFKPEACLWIQTGWINYLLMIVMFGMGLTMKAGILLSFLPDREM